MAQPDFGEAHIKEIDAGHTKGGRPADRSPWVGGWEVSGPKRRLWRRLESEQKVRLLSSLIKKRAIIATRRDISYIQYRIASLSPQYRSAFWSPSSDIATDGSC